MLIQENRHYTCSLKSMQVQQGCMSKWSPQWLRLSTCKNAWHTSKITICLDGMRHLWHIHERTLIHDTDTTYFLDDNPTSVKSRELANLISRIRPSMIPEVVEGPWSSTIHNRISNVAPPFWNQWRNFCILNTIPCQYAEAMHMYSTCNINVQNAHNQQSSGEQLRLRV